MSDEDSAGTSPDDGGPEDENFDGELSDEARERLRETARRAVETPKVKKVTEKMREDLRHLLDGSKQYTDLGKVVEQFAALHAPPSVPDQLGIRKPVEFEFGPSPQLEEARTTNDYLRDMVSIASEQTNVARAQAADAAETNRVLVKQGRLAVIGAWIAALAAIVVPVVTLLITLNLDR